MRFYAFFIVLSLLTISSFSQKLDIKWSEQMKYSNKQDGFFKSVAGVNDKYIYCLFTRNLKKRIITDKYLKIVAFDRQTLQKVSSVGLKGYPENKEKRDLLKKLHYYKTIIFDKVVYVFWTLESSGREEIYVQSFNESLGKLSSIKKVYELTSERSDNKKAEALVLGTKNDLVLIGGEKAAKKEESVTLSYKLLNSDLSFVSSNEVELPIKVTGKSYGLTSYYELGDDGNLYVYSYVSMGKEEQKELGKNEYTYYCIFSAINLDKGAIKSYRIKFDQKNIYSLRSFHDGNSIKLYGYYTDLTIDPKAGATHGLFYSNIEKNTLEIIEEPIFTAFSTEEKNKIKKDEKEPYLVNSIITKVQKYNDRDILFSYKTHSYSYTSCNGKTCHTVIECKNSDVLCMAVNKKGEIEWLNNHDRFYIHNGWYVEDVQILFEDNKFFITYADRNKFDAKRNRKVSKSKRELRDFIDYIILDPENGQTTQHEIVLNPPGTKKKNRKYADASDIVEKNNALYITSTKVKMKPAAIAVSIALIPVLVVGSMIPSFMPSSYYGIGFVGNIQIV